MDADGCSVGFDNVVGGYVVWRSLRRNPYRNRSWYAKGRGICDDTSPAQAFQGRTNQQKGNCPVCRKVFDAKDIEHVLEYLAANSYVMEKKGLIEPRKDLIIMPGMFLPESVEPATTSAEEKLEECSDQARNHGLYLNGDVSMKATASKPNNSNRRRKGSFKGKISTESSRKQWVVKPINTSKQ
ncbi:E3 ubiquitin-protein ligase RNF25 [Dendrobium catenatum]|uniref:E3 ubiquitin-protein ligase RNF25 n=1 Tax=Dendrobium catenatum TaxID=906689 RepID=A0A2I0X4R8_9ASPA|nr:E3 ubiquitin-protein ligase RNF25 [Dendrobium catenatum]